MPEVLYGGAAGGGKSDALLMGALQYVDVPGYSAILFRRTYSDLALPSALMSRTAEWLFNTGAKWTDTTKTWTFPSGATLTFGYLDRANDRYRYQSSEFQFIGFDELTQFPEIDYTYLFSRLRRRADSQIPLRMRGATNPGGRGHAWVKRRFDPEHGGKDGRVFIPARLPDNPHLDQQEYERSLDQLDPFTRKQLKEGSWEDFAGNHFHPADWPRWRYIPERDAYLLQPQRIVPVRDTWRAVFVDPATDQGDAADYTAMLVVAVCPEGQILILDVLRQRLDVGDVIPQLAGLCRTWRPVSFAGLEEVAFMKLLTREAGKHPDIPPVRPLKPAGKGKLARAVPAIVKCDRGEVYLPEQQTPWLDDFQTELAAFTGVNDAEDDQVDTVAYAVPAVGTFNVAGGTDYSSWGPLTPGKLPFGAVEPFPTPQRLGCIADKDLSSEEYEMMYGRPRFDIPATAPPERPRWHGGYGPGW